KPETVSADAEIVVIRKLDGLIDVGRDGTGERNVRQNDLLAGAEGLLERGWEEARIGGLRRAVDGNLGRCEIDVGPGDDRHDAPPLRQVGDARVVVDEGVWGRESRLDIQEVAEIAVGRKLGDEFLELILPPALLDSHCE